MSSLIDKRVLNAAFSQKRGFKDDFEASRLKAIGQRKEDVKRMREKEFDNIDVKIDLSNTTSRSSPIPYTQFESKEKHSVTTAQKTHQKQSPQYEFAQQYMAHHFPHKVVVEESHQILLIPYQELLQLVQTYLDKNDAS